MTLRQSKFCQHYKYDSVVNSYTNDNQTVMRSKEEYQHQRKLEEKMRKKRQEIDDRWARQEEEQLIKQLEEQKRIMNLRYKVAKSRLKKRSKIGAIAATTHQQNLLVIH